MNAIREELRLGKTPRAAVDLGFDRAFRAVARRTRVQRHRRRGALPVRVSGPNPRGFAVTLTVGIITNLNHVGGDVAVDVRLDWWRGASQSATSISI